MAIIGILVAAVTFSYTNAQKKGRDARRKNDLKTIQAALVLYFQEKGTYPVAGDGSYSLSWTDPTGGGLAQALIGGGYITQIRRDPLNVLGSTPEETFYYAYRPSGLSSYTLYANLENNSDPERSGPYEGGLYDYKVIDQ